MDFINMELYITFTQCTFNSKVFHAIVMSALCLIYCRVGCIMLYYYPYLSFLGHIVRYPTFKDNFDNFTFNPPSVNQLSLYIVHKTYVLHTEWSLQISVINISN